MCDSNFPSLIASLFSWRCLAAFYLFLPPRGHDLRPPSVTVSTHTSAPNAVAFQSPAIPNARMLLCQQWVHSFSFPLRSLLRTAPSRFSNTNRFGSRPPLIRMSAPTHKSEVWLESHPPSPRYVPSPPLRNLVSGYECGRVFPAGVGSGLPSRDAANWRSSRFSRSVETRWRCGWLRMVLPLGARLFRSPLWCPSGGGGKREAGSTVAESLVALYRVGTHQIRRGRRATGSLTCQGSAEPLCTRIKGANRELFSFYVGQQGAANGQDSWGFFRDSQGFGRLDAGSCAGFTSSGPPPPWTSVFQFSLFLYNVWL